MATTLEQLKTRAENKTLVGEIENLLNDDYHDVDCPGVSKSDLDLIHKNYNHYRYKTITNSRALVFGSAVHDAILENKLDERYVVEPMDINKRTKVGKAEYAEFLLENNNKKILTVDEYAMVEAMHIRFLENKTCQQIMQSAKMETSLFWNDDETNVLCKCRPDMRRDDGIIIDLKTCADASYNEFRKSIVNYCYDKQAAFYLDGASAALGREFNQFIFICIEKREPYDIAIYHINNEVIKVGRELYKKNLRKYKQFLQTGVSGYPSEIQTMDMAAYGFSYEDR